MNPWKNADLLLACLTAIVVFTIGYFLLAEFSPV